MTAILNYDVMINYVMSVILDYCGYFEFKKMAVTSCMFVICDLLSIYL